jgi:hypothetical protein
MFMGVALAIVYEGTVLYAGRGVLQHSVPAPVKGAFVFLISII